MKNLPPACLAAGLSLACGLAWPTAHNTQLAELADLSLEQLTKITVTSASRREERLAEVPASLFVITQDDIRRSGATSIPEVLRLAPNLHVARADANQYAITARGFNNTLANKLLVLIDGRIVYTPLFSGVFWEAQDVALDDVDRIEVISGPAGTLWGANAVNGVINIITMSASATRGTLVKAGAGDRERGVTLRHGAGTDDASYRVYVKYLEREGLRTQSGADIGDDSRRLQGGFRADWSRAEGMLTLLGDAYRGDVDAGPAREFSGANLTGRLVRTLGAGSTLTVTAYYDRTERRHEGLFEETLETLDIEANHAIKLGERNTLVWGGGYRYSRDDVENFPSQAFLPADRSLRWSNLFAQNEVRLAPTLLATAGVKVERNPYTGNEWLPSLRIAWYPAPGALFWSALSRAVRAPSRLDRELFIPGQAPFALVGNTAFESEVADVFELGYRAQVSHVASVSATLFHHEYDRLRSVARASGALSFANDIEGHVTGIEAWATYRVLPSWRLSGGFVVQDFEREVRAGGVDFGGMPSLGNDAKRKLLLRSTWSPAPQYDVDLAVRHVGMLQTIVPSYTAVDVRLAWRFSPRAELSLTAQNLFDRDHIEWQNRAVNERAVFLKLLWRS